MHLLSIYSFIYSQSFQAQILASLSESDEDKENESDELLLDTYKDQNNYCSVSDGECSTSVEDGADSRSCFNMVIPTIIRKRVLSSGMRHFQQPI